MNGQRKESFLQFMKKRGYLIALGVLCLALVVTTAVVVGSNPKGGSQVEKPKPTASVKPSVNASVIPSVNSSVIPTVTPSISPVVTVIVFDSPVENATVGMTFSEDELCFSQTLGYWYGHMGMDFIGTEGQDCLAVYGGTVESVTRDIASGTVVVIKINDTLSVGYGSLAEDVSVAVGDRVEKGQVIGKISDSAYDEFKEGPHVHLTVKENGLYVNPEKYLQTQEK